MGIQISEQCSRSHEIVIDDQDIDNHLIFV